MAEHMLILKLTSPEGETKYVAGAFPSACGKTNLAMLIPTLPGLEGRDDRRRHRLDEVRPGRPPLRDQPRGRLLRRRAGHEREDEPERDGDGARQCSIFTNCALTDDGDIWWEGMTEEPPRAPDRLARRTTGRPTRTTPGRASERALHDARRAVSVDRAGVGGPGRRADRRDPVRRPALDRRAARARGLRLGARRVPRLDHGLGDDRGGRGRGREAALRPVRDAAVLRLPHGRLLRPLARHRRDGGDADKLPKLFNVNWFRKDADGQVPLARLRREQPRAGVDLPALRGQGRGGRDAGRPRPAPKARSTPRASTSATSRWQSCSRRSGASCGLGCRRSRSTSPSSATGCPQELRDRARQAGGAPRRVAERVGRGRRPAVFARRAAG